MSKNREQRRGERQDSGQQIEGGAVTVQAESPIVVVKDAAGNINATVSPQTTGAELMTAIEVAGPVTSEKAAVIEAEVKTRLGDYLTSCAEHIEAPRTTEPRPRDLAPVIRALCQAKVEPRLEPALTEIVTEMVRSVQPGQRVHNAAWIDRLQIIAGACHGETPHLRRAIEALA